MTEVKTTPKAQHVYIKQITSTVQGGISYSLGPKTLLFGGNTSGKSMGRRAIEVAIEGAATDIAGRSSVAKALDLLQLVPPGVDLFSEAVMSDGSVSRTKILNKVTGKGSKAKKSSSVDEETRPPCVTKDVFPIRELRDAVTGAPTTTRKFFLSKTGQIVTRKDILNLLPESLHAEYEGQISATAGGRSVNSSEVDRLLDVMEKAASTAREKSAEVKTKTETVNEMGQGLPPPPTEDALKGSRRAAADAKAALEASIAYAARQESVVARAQRVAEIDLQLQGLEKSYLEWNGHLELKRQTKALLAPLPSLTDQQNAVIKTIFWHESEEQRSGVGEMCVACGSNVPMGTFHARADGLRAELAKTEDLRKAHVNVDNEIANAEMNLRAVQTQGEEALRSRQSMVDDPNAAPAVAVLPIEQARAADAAAIASLKQLEDSQTAWDSAKKLREVALKAEKDAETWKKLAAACTEVVQKVLDVGVSAFEGKVQAFLPATDRFGLQLHDGGREVCRFGLWTVPDAEGNRFLRTALSGVQWAQVTAAMAAACASSDATKLGVIMPEERAFDADHLADAMEAFSAIPHQVILESPIMPSRIPEGWTVVKVAPIVQPAVPVQLAMGSTVQAQA